MEVLVKNARLRGKDGLWFVGVEGGKISALAPMEETLPAAAEVIDAGGNLVTESFTNAHLHLCKVWTLQKLDEKALQDYQSADMGKAMTAIELAARFGNTHIRAFADIDSKAQLKGVKGVMRARDAFKGKVDVQVVAFPQDGVIREPGTEALIREAMQLGADIVGGIPWIEYTDDDARAHVQKMCAIAREFDKDVSMLVDDAGDPTLKTLEMLAVETLKHGWHGRVLAQHARAMCLYPKPTFQKLVALLKQARIGVVSDPQTGPLHARVKELLSEGALVCLGQDDISDAYYPYGRNNMLEVAFLASHLLWMTTESEMETLYDMVTVNGAQAMGVKHFGLAVGNDAHLVVLGVPSVLEALRWQDAPRYVISHGRVIAETQTTVTLR